MSCKSAARRPHVHQAAHPAAPPSGGGCPAEHPDASRATCPLPTPGPAHVSRRHARATTPGLACLCVLRIASAVGVLVDGQTQAPVNTPPPPPRAQMTRCKGIRPPDTAAPPSPQRPDATTGGMPAARPHTLWGSAQPARPPARVYQHRGSNSVACSLRWCLGPPPALATAGDLAAGTHTTQQPPRNAMFSTVGAAAAATMQCSQQWEHQPPHLICPVRASLEPIFAVLQDPPAPSMRCPAPHRAALLLAAALLTAGTPTSAGAQVRTQGAQVPAQAPARPFTPPLVPPQLEAAGFSSALGYVGAPRPR